MKYNYLKISSLAIILYCAALPLAAQTIDTTDNFSWIKNGYLKGYGVVNYYNFDWETDPNKRNAFDAERLNLYLGFHFNDKIEFKSEIEFEHGGTGVALDFDVLEEFGEFEQEVKSGGEVNVEQINILFKINEHFNVRVGKFRLYTGLASKLDEPIEYFTTYRSETENTILPLGWYEHGVELSGNFAKKWSYKFYVINGLDATGFSSANWVRLGYQKRFETVNANDMAVAGRLDFKLGDKGEVGASFYFGNSTGNRPKPDTDINGYVNVYDLHFIWESSPWRISSMITYGTLSNSEAISELNRNLSNNLDVKRTPVAAASFGAFAEIGYDLLSLNKKRITTDKKFYVFGRYDYYDSMFETKGNMFNNPRWARSVITGGINYFPHPQVVLKAQYANRTLGTDQTENTFSTGVGFAF